MQDFTAKRGCAWIFLAFVLQLSHTGTQFLILTIKPASKLLVGGGRGAPDPCSHRMYEKEIERLSEWVAEHTIAVAKVSSNMAAVPQVFNSVPF